MEISRSHSLTYAGEEKYQMLELNRRLESYLNHVKLLEEENQLLWGEIQALRRSQGSRGHVKRRDEALSLARQEVQDGWKEKDRVELEIGHLVAEIEELNALRVKEAEAQAEARRKVEESRRTLEDERRIQIWLREQAAHLEKEISLQVKLHQEDVEVAKSSLAFTKPVLAAPRHRGARDLQGLGEEYSQRAAQVWQEAAGKYQVRMEMLEESLNQARNDMVKLDQEKRESKIQMQGLAQELEATKVDREILEKNMAQQRDRQKKELQHLQAHVDALETEKVEISEQIGELMVDRRNLLQMKMCLGLEVATYRALLDNESRKDQRNNQPTSRNIRTVSTSERFSRTALTYPAARTLSSGLLGGPQNTTSRSIVRRAHLMTQTSSGTLPRGTLQKPPKKAQVSKEEEVVLREEKVEVKSSAGSNKPFSVSDFLDHYRPSEAHEEPSRSAHEPADLEAVDESEAKDEILEEILIDGMAYAVQDPSGAEEEESIPSQTDNLSGSPDTPEGEESSSLHTDEAKRSDDGDEEVSTEMSQITHAPVSTWEDNDTAALEERDVVSEIELEYENVTENQVGEYSADVGLMDFKQLDENATESAADAFSRVEEKVEREASEDVRENIIQLVEKVPLLCRPEEGIESPEGSGDLRDDEVPDLDINGYKQENRPEFEEETEPEPRTDKEDIHSDEQEKQSSLEIFSVPEVGDEINTGDTEEKPKPVMDMNLTHDHSEDQEQRDESLNLSNQSADSFIYVEEEVKENIIQLVEKEPLMSRVESSEGSGDLRDVEVPGFDINGYKQEKNKRPEEGMESSGNIQSSEVSGDLRDLKGPDFDMNTHEKENQAEFEEETQSDQRTGGEEFIADEKQKEMIEENDFDHESIPQVSSEINNEDAEQKSETVMDKYTHHQSDNFHTKEDEEQSISNQSADAFSHVEDNENEVEREALEDVRENIIQLVEKVPLLCRPEEGIESPEGSGDLRDAEVPDLDINGYEQENRPEFEEETEPEPRTDKEDIHSDEQEKQSSLEITSVPEVGDEINTGDTEEKPKPVMDMNLTHDHSEDQEQRDESLNLSNQSADSFIYVEEEVKENIIQLVEKEPLMSRVESSEGSGDLRDVEVPGSDINEYKQENRPEFEEEELIYHEKQERMIVEDVQESIRRASSVPEVGHDINTEGAEQKPEPMVDTNGTDHSKEDQEQSDEESLNISASWRTDPGDADSYAQENTLADTRPLIHYRSDDEDVGVSHQGTGEATDSEDEDRREGFGHWSQKVAKRFDTMEDLSEEPEMGISNDTDGSVQTVQDQHEMKQNVDEVASQESAQTPPEGLLRRERSGTDDELVCYPETDLSTVRECSQPPEETGRNCNDDVPVEMPDESSRVDDWSESLFTDTSETTELQNPTEQFNSSEEDLIKDYTLNWDLESTEFKAEAENINKPLFGSLPPVADEPLVEQPIEEEELEHSPTVATHTFEACPQEVGDEHPSLSMLTDEALPLPENSSQKSQSENQTKVISSDVEESNSSEDESPNASRCSQLLKDPEIPEIPTQQLDWNLSSTADGSFSGLLEEALKEDKSDAHDGPQAEETGKVSCPGNEEELANTQRWEDSAHPDESTAASQHISRTVQEAGDVDPSADEDQMNIFERDLHEGSEEKENDPHTYFSSSVTEGVRSTSPFGMAATHDQESERVSDGSKDPSKGFGEDREDLGSIPAANGKPEKEIDISTGQSQEDREEEQVMGHAEKLPWKHVKAGPVGTAHVEESTDDGDSWSSGEE